MSKQFRVVYREEIALEYILDAPPDMTADELDDLLREHGLALVASALANDPENAGDVDRQATDWDGVADEPDPDERRGISVELVTVQPIP